MKYIGLLLIIGLIPLLSSLCSAGVQGRRIVAFLFGASPLFAHAAHITIAPVSWPYWPGYVKGVEISFIDAFAVAALVSLRGNRLSANYVVPFIAMMVLAAISAIGAMAPTAALFVAWQFFKVCLIYLAATRLASDFAGIRALVGGMVFGLVCNGAWAVVQHFGGMSQAPGLFDHQNSLGMVAHFVVLPAAALFVADPRARWALLGIAAAGVVAICGASRATIGLEAAGLGLLMVAIALFWPSNRGFMLLGLGVAAMAAMSPFAYKALAPRLASVEVMTYDERAAFMRAAAAMVHDNPMGVGANHYVIISNLHGYSSRGDVTAASGSRSANVHNVYYLTAAEMGYAALVPFVWLSVITALHGAWWAFRSRDKRLAVMLFGACSAQLVVAVHNWFEWVYVTYAIQVMFALNLGIIAALVGQIRASRKREPGNLAQDDGRGAAPARSAAAAAGPRTAVSMQRP